jgi:hypothetical protein
MKAAPEKTWVPLEEAIPRDVFLAEVGAWSERIGVEPLDLFDEDGIQQRA